MKDDSLSRSLSRQAWLSLAAWLAFGIFIEGLIAYRAPAYMQTAMRREMFRLAHAHGAALAMLVLGAALALRTGLASVPKFAALALRVGAILMPLGFLLGGLKVTETDPNAAVLLAPVGGVMVIFAVIAIAAGKAE